MQYSHDQSEFKSTNEQHEFKIMALSEELKVKEKAREQAKASILEYEQKLGDLESQLNNTLEQLSKISSSNEALAAALGVRDLSTIPSVMANLNHSIRDLNSTMDTLKNENQLLKSKTEYYKDMEQKIMQFFVAIGKNDLVNLDESLSDLAAAIENMKAKLAASVHFIFLIVIGLGSTSKGRT